MANRTIDVFLSAPLETRFRMAVDPGNAAALTDYFGAAAYREYVDLAQRGLAEIDQRHLAGEPPVSVIVLPGIMGSTIATDAGDAYWLNMLRLDRLNKLALAADGQSNLDAQLQFAPQGLMWVYDPLLSPHVWAPTGLGYTTHAYDWRKSLRLSTGALRQRILDIFATNGGRGVHLVGHSMGGLLIRATLMDHGDELWDKVGRIVFIGTPHYGSPKLAAFLKFHLWIADFQMRVLGLFLKRTTFRSLWGAIGLLPAPQGIYPGTRHDGSAQWQSGDAGDAYLHPCANFDLYDAMSWGLALTKKELAQLQRMLDDARSFYVALYEHHMGLDQELRDRMAMIVGVGNAMPFRMVARSGGSELRTVDRIEDRLLDDIHREGDGSVPVASAQLESIGATRYIRGEHGQLPMMQAVYQDAFRWLQGQPMQLDTSVDGALGGHLGANEDVEYPALSATGAEQLDLLDLGPLNPRTLDPDRAAVAALRAKLRSGEIALPPGLKRASLL